MRIFKLAGSNFFLGWIMSSMIYLALLAVLFSTVSTLSFDKWRSATRDLVTIHVPKPAEIIDSDDGVTRLDETLKILRAFPDIESFTVLEKNDIERLINPLVDKDILKNILLPALIEIRLKRNNSLPDLNNALKNLSTDIFIESHAELFLPDAKAFSGAKKLFSVIVGLTLFVAMISIIFAVHAGLAINRETIQVMHLIGAKNGFIARTFQKHVLKVLGFSSACGTALAMGTFFILDRLLRVAFFGDGEIDIFKQINLWDWTIFMLVPVSYPLLGIIVAGVSVLTFLRKQN
ncbi:MAG: hypothetical protein CMM24_06840 [Rhodospirillaceae bacterium]|nr:hypothetical protein [Rhodospirillaceae bacterium]